MPAAMPRPEHVNGAMSSSAEIEDVRAVFRKTLAKLKSRSKNPNEDSRAFKLKARLTEVASADDVERRRAYLREAGVPLTQAFDPEAVREDAEG